MSYIVYITGFLEDYCAGICIVACIATVTALIISTKYMRNLVTPQSSRSTDAQTKQDGRDINLAEDKLASSTAIDDADEAKVDDDEESTGSSPVLSPRYPDPVDYCEHIQGEIKRVQQKVATKSIASSLTEEQLREEREIQRQQLADIFRLMQEQQDRFGIGTMDDMQEQMKLYAV